MAFGIVSEPHRRQPQRFLDKQMKSLLALVACIGFAISGLAASTVAADPVTPAKAFYDYYFSHHFPDNVKTMKANQRLFTPGLYAMLLAEFSKPVPAGDAPDIDWDVFTDAQDIPDGFSVGKARIENGIAKVEVSLLWSPKFSKRKSSVTVILTPVDHEWKIKDFHYRDHKNLTAILREVPAATRQPDHAGAGGEVRNTPKELQATGPQVKSKRELTRIIPPGWTAFIQPILNCGCPMTAASNEDRSFGCTQAGTFASERIHLASQSEPSSSCRVSSAFAANATVVSERSAMPRPFAT